jgi:hypothetical protein
MALETPSFKSDDVLMLEDFEHEEVERLLWNLEVIQEQIWPSKIIIVGGTESSDTNEFAGVSLKAQGHTPAQLHAKIGALLPDAWTAAPSTCMRTASTWTRVAG